MDRYKELPTEIREVSQSPGHCASSQRFVDRSKSTHHDGVASDDVEDALRAEEPVPQPQRLGVRGVRQEREVRPDGRHLARAQVGRQDEHQVRARSLQHQHSQVHNTALDSLDGGYSRSRC